MFITVPNPGFCFKKNQKNKTPMLIKKVATPIERSVMFETPSARTVQGEFPVVDIKSKASPKPNKIKPKHKYENVDTLGLKLKGLSELHGALGIFLIFKNISIKYFFY